MSREKTENWLKAASAIVIGFGLVMLLGTLPATSAPVAFLTDLIFWPVDGRQVVSAPETRLLWAISGGILTGWGLLLWQISTRLYPQDPSLARTLILSSIGIWFLADGLGSILAGAPLNAVLNIGFLLLFFVPLWRPIQRAEV
ncbi:hypothetical protein [Denitrobaculum tricleocarpae]|uniref:Excinuclease ABC subunit A n=1 Tax=Denitrobaculum tricleocarpae TaxID=2591009 RepID=A0A545T0C8_9PROT|nr:hypothetical protein [Denitrobaculum tricleocarpae]TQV70660.1 hypothetical protein FKG95_27785 [Denitrobaculum tricleocarpae]